MAIWDSGKKPAPNSKEKASRFRVDPSEEGKTAAAAFRKPAPPKSGSSSSGSKSGGNGAANPLKKAAEAVQGATSGRPNQPNPRDKASRFRIDQDREEGSTAARAFRKPGAGSGPQGSSSSWTVPSKYASADAGGRTGESLQKRADAYMKGAITARDFATTLRSKKLDGVAIDIIGSMPDGPKRANLFKIFTQV
jgi:hypothetical protein